MAIETPFNRDKINLALEINKRLTEMQNIVNQVQNQYTRLFDGMTPIEKKVLADELWEQEFGGNQ